MVLNNVADGSGLIVETASTLDAEVLGHGDLHTLDISAVPKRLDKSVGETERQHVVDRALAQVVADARSCPKGFSTMTRPPLLQSDSARCCTTVSNKTGGMAR